MSGGSYNNYRGSWSERSDRSYDYDAEDRRRRAAEREEERERDARRREELRRQEEARRAAEDRKREEAEAARAAELTRLRAKAATATTGQRREKRDERDLFDPALVKNTITQPSSKSERGYVILVDNSGSNRKIADHLKKSSGHMMAALNAIDPRGAFAWDYFSDHGDGQRRDQFIDWVRPDETGDRILFSTLCETYDADGGDAPEAIECSLAQVCDFDFAHIEKPNRHLILVTDVVAHGMGLTPDRGCPQNVDWRESVRRANETFGSFTVVGCSGEPEIGRLQTQFITDKKRLPYDLIDLSEIESHTHRLAITGNAVLFLVARTKSMQAVELFLSGLYEKWLEDPIFGANTEMGAREAIKRFGKYLEAPPDKVDAMLKRVFG